MALYQVNPHVHEGNAIPACTPLGEKIPLEGRGRTISTSQLAMHTMWPVAVLV